MMLSRVFCLLFGTTLFILVWTMQDGSHGVPRMVTAAEYRSVRVESQPALSMPARASVETEVEQPKAIAPAPVIVATPAASVDNALWMFADESPEQIAAK